MTFLRKTFTLRGWLLIALLLLVLGAFSSTEAYFARLGRRGALPWWKMLADGSSPWLAWSLLAPVIFYAARRFGYEDTGRIRTVLIHLLIGCILAPIYVFLNLGSSGLISLITDPGTNPWAFASRLKPNEILSFHILVPVQYLIYVLFAWAWIYYCRFRAQELVAAQLQGQLAQAELRSLKMQVNPHFLFNALNSISTLQRVDLAGAEHTLDLLARLLRRSVDAASVQELCLQEELAFIRDYLELEQIRFSNRLHLQWEIDPDVQEALVPHLILQPLVENAIKHGFWPTAQPGIIRITARHEGQVLYLGVEDDGMGLKPGASQENHEGVGLTNSRLRLRQLYGDEAGLQLISNEPRGARALVKLPFRTPSDRQNIAGLSLLAEGQDSRSLEHDHPNPHCG